MGQKRITIRPLRLDDADDIHEIMHMPDVLMGTSVLPSMTVEAWRKTISEWVTDEYTHVFVADINGKVVGVITLWAGKGRESHKGDIAMAVHDAYQGQGIGKMLLFTIVDLADNWLNLVRLELDVFTDNERAVRLYKHLGFEIEGKKRSDAFRGGNYIDSYLMGRLRPQAQQAQADYAAVLTQSSQSEEPSSSPNGQQ